MDKLVPSLLAVAALLGGTAMAQDASYSYSYDVVTSAEKTKVILDTDIRYNTDDMYTLMFLLQADAAGYIDLLGITTAPPGVRTEVEGQMALSMLEKVGRGDIPVYIGQNQPVDGQWYADEELVAQWKLRLYDNMKADLDPNSEVDYSSMQLGGEYDPATHAGTTLGPAEGPAWEFMIDQVKQYPGEVVIMSIGGVTNTALAIQNDPTFAANTSGIYYMGGVTPRNGANGAGSFNWATDAKAVNIALNADFPRQVLIPSEISNTVILIKDVMDQIVAADTPVAKLIKDVAYGVWEEEPEREQSFWDVVTPAVLMIPSIIDDTEVRYMQLDEQVGPFLGVLRQWKEGRQPDQLNPVEVVWTVHNEVYWDFLVGLYTTDFRKTAN
ncbi:nucleoside hydrolase [Cereibacter sp. SYSU M97828]|nr:nucleoside hydrolase [Cereibacter flavus]